MQAIILAGGFGTRLAPLTYTRAKSMLPLHNKPMIAHLIETLPQGIDIIVAANYKNEQLKDYFDTHGIQAIINKEHTPLGTAGAVKHAERYIDGPFLVLNSDIIASMNMRNFIRAHLNKKAFVTISLWPVHNVEEYGVVDLSPNGRIVKFVEKPKRHEAPSNLINAGAYCLNFEILDYIKPHTFVSMEKEVFPHIIADGKPFYGHTFDGYWVDVGRPNRYTEITTILLKKKGIKYLCGTSEIKGVLKQSTVGDNCLIDANSIIKSSIIYDGCVIGKHVIMDQCIISDNCTIQDKCTLSNVIVGDGETISQDSVVKNITIWSKPLPSGYPTKQIGNPVK